MVIGPVEVEEESPESDQLQEGDCVKIEVLKGGKKVTTIQRAIRKPTNGNPNDKECWRCGRKGM